MVGLHGLRASFLAAQMKQTDTPVTPVLAKNIALYSSAAKSDDELLAMYDEELFIDSECSDEDDTLEQQDLAALFSVSPGGSGFATYAVDATTMRKFEDSQSCRPWLAQQTTVLFDMEIPKEGDSAEISLFVLVNTEGLPTLYAVPKQIVKCSTTPGLFESSELVISQTRAVDSVHDGLSHMTDSDPCKDLEIQQTAHENAPKTSGRSLMHPPLVYSAAELVALAAEDVDNVDEQDTEPKRTIKRTDSAKCPLNLENVHGGVLCNITGQAFLPGVEHLSNVESRSAFVTYHDDVEALEQATTNSLDDRYHTDNVYLGNKVGAMVFPRGNILLAHNDTDFGLSVERPTAQSLLDLIDELVYNETFAEDEGGPPNAPMLVQEEFPSFDSRPTGLSYLTSPPNISVLEQEYPSFDPSPTGLLYLDDPRNAPCLEQGEFSIFESSPMDLSYEEPSHVEGLFGLSISQDGAGSDPKYVSYPTLALLTCDPSVQEAFLRDASQDTAGREVKYVHYPTLVLVTTELSIEDEQPQHASLDTAYPQDSDLAIPGQLFRV
jgi:hypothetical protein